MSLMPNITIYHLKYIFFAIGLLISYFFAKWCIVCEDDYLSFIDYLCYEGD